MDYVNDLLQELKQEAAVTRRYLALVDFSKADFQIHDKSEKFGRLAIHNAEILYWFKNVLSTNELNFKSFLPKDITSTYNLLSYFDQLLIEVEALLEKTSLADLEKEWTMKHGEDVLFSLNKKEVFRKFCLNHLVHHRAQLGIYLRILRIDVPATYGPSKDDGNITLTEAFY